MGDVSQWQFKVDWEIHDGLSDFGVPCTPKDVKTCDELLGSSHFMLNELGCTKTPFGVLHLVIPEIILLIGGLVWITTPVPNQLLSGMILQLMM